LGVLTVSAHFIVKRVFAATSTRASAIHQKAKALWAFHAEVKRLVGNPRRRVLPLLVPATSPKVMKVKRNRLMELDRHIQGYTFKYELTNQL
jgi:hypothetical protein